MNEENVNHETPQPEAEKAPAETASVYKLDWETIAISLAKGRFKHTLRRPTSAEILDREKEIQSEIPIGKDGAYRLPDPTELEETDAKYHDVLLVKAEGYQEGSQIPERHKAAAFQGMYRREVDLEEGCDIFGDEITIVEEFGTGDEPDYVIKHVMRPPTEEELKIYRRKTTGGELKPGKRGKQKLVTTSNLKHAMACYDLWMIRIEGATVAGETFTSANRAAWIAAVDPLIQRKVVAELVEAFAGGLLD